MKEVAWGVLAMWKILRGVMFYARRIPLRPYVRPHRAAHVAAMPNGEIPDHPVCGNDRSAMGAF
jgi:hypothetical protein